jgi:hypothetical protein
MSNNLVAHRRSAKTDLRNFFQKKGYGIINRKNKLAYSLFSSALNSASNKTQLNSILQKARNYQNKMFSLIHATTNQGPGYGYPILVLYHPPANANNRQKLINNVKNFKSSGNLNSNLKKINGMINRLNAIKKFEKNIGMMRYK